jgi:hypothetical protein
MTWSERSPELDESGDHGLAREMMSLLPRCLAGHERESTAACQMGCLPLRRPHVSYRTLRSLAVPAGGFCKLLVLYTTEADKVNGLHNTSSGHTKGVMHDGYWRGAGGKTSQFRSRIRFFVSVSQLETNARSTNQSSSGVCRLQRQCSQGM